MFRKGFLISNRPCVSGHDTLQPVVFYKYNLLSSIKRSLDYETIGGLLGDVYAGVHELTVVEKIWAIIVGVVAIVAELTGADEEDLILQIIDNDKRLAALRDYAQTA